jgi:hypothetical protein
LTLLIRCKEFALSITCRSYRKNDGGFKNGTREKGKRSLGGISADPWRNKLEISTFEGVVAAILVIVFNVI